MLNPYSKELLCGAKKIDMSKFGNDIWKMMQHEKRGDFMYESPITNYISEIIDKQMVERENFILATVSEKIGIDVNREELIKALNYDRQQYEKGYADAKAEYKPKDGKWLYRDGDNVGYCSECGEDGGLSFCSSQGDFRFIETDFCPNCGADMRKESEE